jgi:outer membrane protein OmpA-like peptidoglycan-associated protein
MYSEDEDTPKRAALIVVFGVVAAVVVAVVTFGAAHRTVATAPATVLATATAMVKASEADRAAAPVSEASAASLAALDAASIKVENGVVKFYFASGKADLAAGAGEALADVVKQAKDGASSGRKLLVSGFHDATGDAAKNAELAKQRAMAVRDALVASGVSASQVELKKPEQTQAGGNDAEARRVEVSVQ